MVSGQTFFKFLVLFCVSTAGIDSHTTQRAPSSHGSSSHEEAAEDFNPFLELASALGGQQGGGGGAGALGGIVSLVGNLMQNQDSGKAAGGGGANIGSIIAGVSSLFANGGGGNGGGGGFDPSIIGNVIEMFTANNDNGGGQRAKRGAQKQQENSGPNWEGLLDIAMTFMGNQNNNNNNQQRGRANQDNNAGGGLMSLLPLVMNVVNSFNSPEGEKIAHAHKDHAWILPPFLEKIHIMWDHFQHSELAQVLWMQTGLNKVFMGFTDREGKMDYGKLFKSLENQNFRRRWIKAATDYTADWVNHIANPDVYMSYAVTGQMLANGFLQSQGFPKSAQLDISRPTESLSSLVDYVVRKYLNTKVTSITYIKPAVGYVKDLVALGKARGLDLKNMNTTDISEKLTDTLNLELIEPVLRVHRAYRYAVQVPHCDKYVLCEINSHDPHEKVGLATGFKAGITKFGSYGAAWFVSGVTGTPFWNLFAVVNEPYNCESRFPSDCTGFHDGEQHVTTEYVHNEL